MDVELTLEIFLDCGATYFTDGSVRETLVRRAPHKKDEIEKMTFGGFTE